MEKEKNIKDSTTDYKRFFNPKDYRLDLIEKSPSFYEYDLQKKIWKKLRRLLRQSRKKSKIRGILITGASDAGKTTLVRQFIVAYIKNKKGAKKTDLIYFRTPPRLAAKGVFAELCRKIGIPDIPDRYDRHNTQYFLRKAAAKLKKDHKLLFIDETQILIDLGKDKRKDILTCYNELINEARIPIVLIGVEGVDIILKDIWDDDITQLKETFGKRFPEMRLEKWEETTEFVGILKAIYKDLLLKSEKEDMFYIDDDIRDVILEMTEGLLGRIILLFRETASIIIEEGLPEKITYDLLIEVGEALGMETEREESFEEE